MNVHLNQTKVSDDGLGGNSGVSPYRNSHFVHRLTFSLNECATILRSARLMKWSGGLTLLGLLLMVVSGVIVLIDTFASVESLDANQLTEHAVSFLIRFGLPLLFGFWTWRAGLRIGKISDGVDQYAAIRAGLQDLRMMFAIRGLLMMGIFCFATLFFFVVVLYTFLTAAFQG